MMTFDEYLDLLKAGNINQRIAAFILEHGPTDEAHRKDWVIDQVLRRIAGEAYDTLIEQYETGTGLPWNTGMAP